MNNFKIADISLTEQQKKQVQKAVAANSGVKLRFSNHQLSSSHGGQLPLTTTQFNKVAKSAQQGKGCDITLTKTQLNKMKTGGFLPLILPALIGAIAPFFLNKLFPQNQDGNGINIPGRGINIPGSGINIPLWPEDQRAKAGREKMRSAIMGNNGGPISNNISGNHSSFYENQTDPYENVAKRYKPLANPKYGNNLKSKAAGFMQPNSDNAFQMLQ